MFLLLFLVQLMQGLRGLHDETIPHLFMHFSFSNIVFNIVLPFAPHFLTHCESIVDRPVACLLCNVAFFCFLADSSFPFADLPLPPTQDY